MVRSALLNKKRKTKLSQPVQKEPGKHRANETEEEMFGLTHLQDQIGNQATQQLLARNGGDRALQAATMVQRQEAPRAGFNPLDPAVIGAAAREVIAQNEAPVRRWLDEKLDSLRLLSLAEIVARIRQEVPEASRLADVELQSMAQEWARQHGFMLLSGPRPEPAGPKLSIAMPDAVRRAFSIATDGINIIQLPNGRVNIAVSGATLELGRGRLSLGWSGSLGFEIPVEGFHLGGQVSKDQWELTLSTPGESSVPDLNKLTEVFQQAETALRGMVAATAKLRDLDDVGAVQGAISPHIKPVKEAVQALKDLAAAPRFSVGITAGGPMSGSEAAPVSATAPPEGVSVKATITFRF